MSTLTPLGLQRLLAPGGKLQTVLVKLGWPNTRSATVSVVNGVLYSSTRLFSKSAIYTLPEASTATLTGLHRVLRGPAAIRCKVGLAEHAVCDHIGRQGTVVLQHPVNAKVNYIEVTRRVDRRILGTAQLPR